MRRLLLRIITAIQLTRLTIAFGAVSDIWFVILVTRADDQYAGIIPVATMPLGPALTAGAVIAVGLFAYGAALNDVLDVRHDATFSPERPIPAGRIRLSQAVVVSVGSLIVAVLAAVGLGTWALYITLFSAAGLLFYNATGKFIPAAGVITIGLVHAAHMFIPNNLLALTLPVWLVMTHAMTIAILVHQLEDKRPHFTPRAFASTLLGWLFWSVVILGLGIARDDALWPADISTWRLIWPFAAVCGFIAMAFWKTSRVSGRAAAEKLKRYGAMWQALYSAAWLLALGLNTEALAIGLFAITGFAAMTIIKEATGISGRPIAWRA